MIELIQNTGIQFIEIPLNIDEGDNLSSEKSFAEEIIYDDNGKEVSGSILFPYKWNDTYIDFDSINAEAIDSDGSVIPENIKGNFVKTISTEQIYKIRGREAFDIYSAHWIPIPYFRVRNDKANPYHAGPQNWCRMWFGELDLESQKKEGYTHKIVLAFDTNTANEDQSDYLIPNASDATSTGNSRFKCVTKERFFTSFYSRIEIINWLTNIYDLKSKKDTRYFRHFANYFVLLEILEKANGFPEIALLSGERSIETGLILDIGNSRTCGILVETTSPQPNKSFDFTTTKKLQVRDLSVPYKVYDEPFEMQVAFAEEKFGNEASDLFDGVFEWPSLVRVGKEAVRLTSIFESGDAQATMSSPKRYLWDRDSSSLPWIKVDKDGYIGYTQNANRRKAALYGISEYLNDDGSLNQNGFPTTQSNYSRSSLMTFAAVEIIMHALAQINSSTFRKDMGNSSFRRVLKNIVVTCPTAMTKKEQSYLRQSIDNAISIVKKYYKESIHEEINIHPIEQRDLFGEEKKNWKYDEATCSQITYLYSVLVDKFLGRHQLFFDLNGKKRENSLFPDQSSITIASVDIGGGTTDLMICNYQVDAESEIPILKPTPLFWEGFNIAGDDIIKRIIEFVVLPSVEKYLKDNQGVNVEPTLNYLFGHNTGDQPVIHRIYRKQFSNQVATYCAYDAIDHILKHNVDRKKSIRDIFTYYPKPKNDLIPYINNIISVHCQIADFDFYDVLIDLDTKQINYAIADIIKTVIDQLTKLIGIFDCDILLLSGRSSNLGIIRELFENSLVMSPDKIINFGAYRFGDWYPFASFGEVKDPKTTVSVGALIAFLSSINKLDKFRIDLSRLSEVESTAEYMGVLSEGNARIREDKIIFNKNQYEGKFKFYGAPVPIGMRQIPLEEWIATPIYIFGFKDDYHRELLSNTTYEYPFTVSIQRDEENIENLLMDDIEIIDRNGEVLEGTDYFKLIFKTLPHDADYWKDNGSFLLKNYSDGQN